MPDPGNPENPDQDPKPFKPDRNKKFLDFGPPTPRKLNEGDDQPHQNQSPETDQETRFRAAAIKCAQMEEELYKALTVYHENVVGLPNGVYIYKFGDSYSIYSNKEKFQPITGQEKSWQTSFATIKFDDEKKHAKLLGVNTRYYVGVNLHTDDSTREEFEEFAKKNSLAGNARTEYYFGTDGSYGKISCVPPSFIFDSTGKRYIWKGVPRTLVDGYESEMKEGDFEIAGQAIQMLIKRAQNPLWDQEAREKPGE